MTVACFDFAYYRKGNGDGEAWDRPELHRLIQLNIQTSAPHREAVDRTKSLSDLHNFDLISSAERSG
jgi:hypothetical protein